MIPSVADPSLAADAQSLANLKSEAAAHDPRALRAAAQQFESLFIDMMLKSARAANFKDPLFGSQQQRLYQGMYDQQLASELSQTHAFGLAEMLVQQLRRQWGSPASSAPSPTGTSSAAAIGSTPGTSARPAATHPPTAVSAVHAPAATPSQNQSPGVSAAQQTAFAQSLWPDAERAGRRLGVSPVGLIAQAALETDWGRHMPSTATGKTSNNLFGIKTSAGWRGSSVLSGTHEYRNGSASAVQARFRAYQNCSQCFQDYTALLSNDPRYADALGTGNNVGAFASALQHAGYATDPNYARKLTAVADTLSRTLAGQSSTGSLKLAAVRPITTRSTAF